MSATTTSSAPVDMYDVIDGFHTVMCMLKLLSDAPVAVQTGGAPACVDLKVADRESVELFAVLFETSVSTSVVGPVEVVKTSARYDGVHLTVHAVIHNEPTLRRDPEATIALAERDV